MKKVVDIRKWGQPMWDVLYSIAFSFPDNPTPQERAALKNFLQSLEHILPCEHCREHFSAYVASHPIPTDSSEAVSNWVLGLNNNVNARIGKPQLTMQDVWGRLVDNGPVIKRQCIATLVCALIVGAVFLFLLFKTGVCKWK